MFLIDERMVDDRPGDRPDARPDVQPQGQPEGQSDGVLRTYLIVATRDAADLDAIRVGLIESGDGESGDGERAITGVLSGRAIAVVMRRYGRELDPESAHEGQPQGHLALGDCVLERLRFRARVDASSRDYLVWREPGRPALAALSNGIAAALRHLASRR